MCRFVIGRIPRLPPSLNFLSRSSCERMTVEGNAFGTGFEAECPPNWHGIRSIHAAPALVNRTEFHLDCLPTANGDCSTLAMARRHDACLLGGLKASSVEKVATVDRDSKEELHGYDEI